MASERQRTRERNERQRQRQRQRQLHIPIDEGWLAVGWRPSRLSYFRVPLLSESR